MAKGRVEALYGFGAPHFLPLGLESSSRSIQVNLSSRCSHGTQLPVERSKIYRTREALEFGRGHQLYDYPRWDCLLNDVTRLFEYIPSQDINNRMTQAGQGSRKSFYLFPNITVYVSIYPKLVYRS